RPPFQSEENHLRGGSQDGGLRRSAARPAAQNRQFLRRQSTKARFGARNRSSAAHHAGWTADARRRHRRDRIHPSSHRRRTRFRQSGVSRFGRARRDFLARRSHHRAVRRPGDRRASARGDKPAGPRPADGGRLGAGGMSNPLKPLPVWADVALIPLLNVGAAFLISGLVVLAIGEDPIEAVKILIVGALGDLEGIGFTLYYATSFIFTGLAVAICFHAGLFNIGVECQAYMAGLGAALAALKLGFLPGYSLVAAAILGAALFGAAFAFIPGYLQAKRDAHIVITTIMFNYVASALLGYLLVDVLRVPGQMNAETAGFSKYAIVPQFHELL